MRILPRNTDTLSSVFRFYNEEKIESEVKLYV